MEDEAIISDRPYVILSGAIYMGKPPLAPLPHCAPVGPIEVDNRTKVSHRLDVIRAASPRAPHGPGRARDQTLPAPSTNATSSRRQQAGLDPNWLICCLDYADALAIAPGGTGPAREVILPLRLSIEGHRQ